MSAPILFLVALLVLACGDASSLAPIADASLEAGCTIGRGSDAGLPCQYPTDVAWTCVDDHPPYPTGTCNLVARVDVNVWCCP